VAIPGPAFLNCPTQPIVVPCTDSTGANVTFNVTGGRLCGDAIPVICDPPSGSHFPVGTTTVTCILADPEFQLSCKFAVTVTCTQITHTVDITVVKGVPVLSWISTAPLTLQSAKSPEGPWTPVPGARSPFQVPLTEKYQFFRVVPTQ
jgi:hypothetical protein